MRSRAVPPLCLAAALWLGGCRQADGPSPDAGGEVPNRLEDISKDLGNIAAGHAGAGQDLADDLAVFVDAQQKPDAAPLITELARQIASALPKTTLAENRGLRLARQLWLTVASRELSEKQVETLQSDVRAALVGVGVPEPRARTIAAHAGTVHNQVSDRKRRWYEF